MLNTKQREIVRAAFFAFTLYVFTAWGVGKSVALAYVAWKSLQRWAPGVDLCFVAPTMGQLQRTLVKAWEKVADPRFYRLVKSGPEPRIEFFGGRPATIYLFSADAEERIEGPSFGGAFVDECQDVPKSTIDRLRGRLRDVSVAMPRLVLGGLPESGTWAHEDLVVHPLPGLQVDFPADASPPRPETPLWIRGKTEDNQEHLHPSYIPTLARTLPTNLFRSRVLGEFANPEGLVYPAFQRARHVRPAPFQKGYRVVVGIDFNVTPYLPAVIYQEHPECDETWGVAEIVLPESSVKDLVPALLQWCEGQGIDHQDPTQIVLVPDASGASRAVTDLSSPHAILKKAGFVLDVPAANPEVSARDNAVDARLGTADGNTHLRFDPTGCARTIAAFEAVRREGRKRHPGNHLLDAAGYPLHRFHPVARFSYDEWVANFEKRHGEISVPDVETNPSGRGGWF